MLVALLGEGFTAERHGKRVVKPAVFCPNSVGRSREPDPPQSRQCRGLLPRALLAAAVVVACLLPFTAVARDGTAKDIGGDDGKTAHMLALVNAARAESGLAGVVAEPRLAAAACRHARDLAKGGPLTHRGSDGSHLSDRLVGAGYEFAMAAENLAAGVTTADETVWLWLGSPGHRRNILTPDFRQAGVARLTGAGGEIWVLVLATPQASAATIPPSAQTGKQSGDLARDKPLTCY